jgi:3'-phosphoadenosine 5'-phosphosulfate sulfotransferase (PAPS reductase)/FAD synthetase
MDKVLQFSGGKDSLACLYLLEKEWGELMVLVADTGDWGEEREAEMTAVERMVPHFRRVKGDRGRFVREVGWPVDMLPWQGTKLGNAVMGSTPVQFAAAHDCCMQTMWLPMAEAVREEGARIVYRGVRAEDKRRPPVPDGAVIDGVEYRFPVYNWTQRQVLDYLGDKAPAYVGRGESASADCEHCTAYLDENRVRIANLPARSKGIVMHVLREHRKLVQAEMEYLDEVLHGYD